jgi:hypothetical protein
VKTFSGKIRHPDIDRNAYRLRSVSATADVLSKTLQVDMGQRGAIVRAAQTYLSDAGYYRTSLIVCTWDGCSGGFLSWSFYTMDMKVSELGLMRKDGVPEPVPESSFLRRLLRANDDPAKQRCLAWLIEIDDRRLLEFGLSSRELAILRKKYPLPSQRAQ